MLNSYTANALSGIIDSHGGLRGNCGNHGSGLLTVGGVGKGSGDTKKLAISVLLSLLLASENLLTS